MNFEILSIGKSVENRDIIAYSNASHPKRPLYLLAGTHGDEPESIFVLAQLFEWLKIQSLNYDLIIVPVLNPDGLAQKSRVNANKVDLNRNYPTTDWSKKYHKDRYFPGTHANSEPENQFLCQLLDHYPPGFVISFHSWKAVLNFNGDAADIAWAIHKLNGYPISGDIGYPTPGSFGTYIDEKFGVGTITYECPEQKDQTQEKTWLENQAALCSLLSSELIKLKLC